MMGFVFQNWKVISEAENTKSTNAYWLCKCQECGREKVFCGSEIRLGRTGMCRHPQPKKPRVGKIKDEVGNIYGKLSVVQLAYTKNSWAYWLCKCECGGTTIVRREDLRQGQVHSCGCLRSYKEYEITKILSELSVPYKREYSFEDLADAGKLRFDFAVFDANQNIFGLIEYQGSQHFSTPEPFNHYGLLQRHDQMKAEYCQTKAIPLLTLDKTHNLKDTITEWLQKYKWELL